MERHILRYSYLLGLICAAVAFLWRIVIMFGVHVGQYIPGERIGYMSFLKAAGLFLLVAIASGIAAQQQSKS
ncbi:MAG TPA: hypothetical protein VNL38_01870 [Candidatus Nitrosotenuis sp.]|nr:hypothetical protein [Candidatus Nitrosotenuis sp.]